MDQDKEKETVTKHKQNIINAKNKTNQQIANSVEEMFSLDIKRKLNKIVT